MASGSGRCTGFTGGRFVMERKGTADMQIWVSVCRKGWTKLTVVAIVGADYKSMFFELLSFHFLVSVSVRTLPSTAFANVETTFFFGTKGPFSGF